MKRPWQDFSHVQSQSAVHGARAVLPSDLVALENYKKSERIASCAGEDPLKICVAYAQTSLIYDATGRIVQADPTHYTHAPRAERVNIFGLAYRSDAQLWLHRTLADIVVEAAIILHQSQGWTTVIFDGLRTVEAAFALYQLATDDDIAQGLLALPGYSAHNKGLAVDSMMFDAEGREIDMGGHFDHTDMSTNMRHYAGERISKRAKENRLIREAAFLQAAFSQDLLVAPLRNEFWDDRLPENRADLWRVLDSAARVAGVPFTLDRASMEQWSYNDFLAAWQGIFAGTEETLFSMLGVTHPPLKEKPEFYHGNYHPLYCRDLKSEGKHLTQA